VQHPQTAARRFDRATFLGYPGSDVSQPSFTVGSVVAGKYKVVRVLGQGGMGMVLEVQHVQLGGRSALKLLHGEHASDPEMVARFENEARLAANLRSEHVVRVTDMGRVATGEPFLVMDYLQGADLDQLLEAQGRFPITTAVSWILEACVGLAHLHAAGSVHRDIKPSNLFWSQEADGRQLIKVLDFGLAKAPSAGGQRLTATSASFGTPQFMAPEQIMSAKHVDARCDQHALALVLYELLTGEPAFPGETAGAITVAIATQPAPAPSMKRPEVPASLDAVIARALAKRPSDRYPTLGELAHALAPFGGPRAAELARATAKLLSAAPGSTDPLAAPVAARTALSVSDDTTLNAPTLIRPPDVSTTGLTSSTRPQKHKGSALWLPAALLAVAGVAAGGFFAWRAASPKSSGVSASFVAQDEATAATPGAPAPEASSSTPATVQVEPTTSPVASAAVALGSSSVAAPTPSASASPKVSSTAGRGPATAKPVPSAAPPPTATAKPTSTGLGGVLDNYKPK
jgi:serine/threonine protein kinase